MSLREQNYWDSHYSEELRNFQEDGDEGDIWFGKALSKKIVEYIIRTSSESQDKCASIIDIGCGNSFLLISIAEKLSDPSSLNLLGIDFSRNSIELSEKIIAARNLSSQIELKQCDFLDLDQVQQVSRKRKFNYIIDKGTYDAICLLASESPDKLEEAKVEYLKCLFELVEDQSIFIFASCNHTEEEQRHLLTSSPPSNLAVNVIDKIETPKMVFGGVQGSTVSCIIVKFANKL